MCSDVPGTRLLTACVIFCRAYVGAMGVHRILLCWTYPVLSSNTQKLAKFGLIAELWSKNCLAAMVEGFRRFSVLRWAIIFDLGLTAGKRGHVTPEASTILKK